MKQLVMAIITLLLLVPQINARDRHDRTIIIENNTSFRLTYFWVANVGGDYSPRDLLGRSTIRPYSEREVDVEDYSGYCMYNVLAVFEDGEEIFDTINACEDLYFSVYE
ncbi:hypothetical protein [Vibrio alfacsensis]|uniref:hypothetical protein n=1 Tax=Vibrio alfacsensis TaxID=1074311 RepID=UPI001BEF73E7|nr:hypothetical protein [Vibrio alfacsensis]BCN24098.1 hypothetical protein VYA_12900 [Vibrio alfacsensis]